ncbi:MAG: SPOR domain-containing protein [Robiginitomaculum sp.]
MTATRPPANDSHANSPHGEIYSPAMDEAEFDARESTSRRSWILLASVIGALLLAAIVILKAYAPGTRDGGEPPRILADTSPYKSAPENPGGAQTPNQDKSVYDVISGETRNDDVTLAPATEEPIKVEPTPNAATVIVKKPEVVTPKPVTTKPAYVPVSKPVPAAPAVKVGNGDYVVQVASLRSQAEANESWTKLNKKLGDIIPSALFADIKRADLEGKGVFYRLRVSGFADKAAAKTFCASLKSRKQDCIVVKK